MTWTYTPSSLASSALFQVRLLIGDTLSTDQQLQDEEIDFVLTERPNLYGAAAECCRSLAAKFSRSVDQAAGATRAAFSQLAKAYNAKAADFEAKAAAAGSALPYAGGISVADKQRQEMDPDRVQPQFDLGMDDDFLPFPSAGNETEDQGSE